MSTSSDKRPITPVVLAIDAILVIGFFALMFWLVKSHVPSNDPKMVTLWGALTAACMSGVFWLAVQMCREVHYAQVHRLAKR